MKDIFASNSKNKIIDIRKRMAEKPAAKKEEKVSVSAESFVLKVKPRERRKNRFLIPFVTFVLILLGIAGYFVYRYSFAAKPVDNAKAQDSDEFQDLDETFGKLDSEVENIKNDSTDVKPPVVDLNVTI